MYNVKYKTKKIKSRKQALAHQFVAVATNVDDLDVRVFFQFLSEFGDEHVHAAGTEEVVVVPQLFEDDRSVQDGVAVVVQMKE